MFRNTAARLFVTRIAAEPNHIGASPFLNFLRPRLAPESDNRIKITEIDS